MAIRPGQQLGQYVVEKKIGEGGMGAVYLANQPSIHRRVVLKVLTTGLSGDHEMLERFKREVDIIAKLEHPHILPVYDFGVIDGDPYIVMRYMAGGSLLEALEAGRLNRDQLLVILDQVAQALDYAHDREIIHRDLKPANVMLDDSNNGYLGDFGLAKTMEGSQELTKTGSVLGTPAYMSPEQARGEHLDGRSDVYSFAIMAFEALSGSRPFEAKTPMEFIRKHLSEPPRSIVGIAGDIPPQVDSTMSRALAKYPAERPNTASEFMQELRASLAGRDLLSELGRPAVPIRIHGPGGAASLPRPTRRGWALPALALGVVGLGLVGIVAVAGLILLLRGPLAGPQVHTYPVGDSPRAIAFAGDSVWVTNGLDSTLAQLQAQGCQEANDPCGQALQTLPVDTLPVGLAEMGGKLWVAGALHQTLTPFDLTSHQAGVVVQLPSVPSSLVKAGSWLWTPNAASGTLTKIDGNGQVVGEYTVGQGAQAVTEVGDSLWVANGDANSLMEIDPKTGLVRRTIQVDGAPSSLAWDGNLLWVALPDANAVATIDTGTGAVLNTLSIDGRPIALVFDGASVWVALQKGNQVARMAVDSGKVIQTLSVPGGPYALTAVDCGTGCRDIWIVDEAGDSVSRVRVK